MWNLRMTSNRATGFTPFFMVYGSETVLPTDLHYGAPRVRAYDEQCNETALQDVADLLDEAWEVALARTAKYQQALHRYHARRVRGRAFNVRDLVVRLTQSTKEKHKLTPPL
ncbi:unnamed protein product [Urochloa humidicola]